MEFSEVLKARKSRRWYQDKPVQEETIKKILEWASLSPSFMNNQPWEVAVVTGQKLKEVAELMDKRYKEKKSTHSISWDINWPERQREIFEKKKKEANTERILPEDPLGIWMYNAPAVLLIHIHRDLNEWALFDIGLFAQTLMLSATAMGVNTVPQARMGNDNEEVAEILGLGKERRIIMGVTMGYADETHSNNRYRSPRQDFSEWTTWHNG
ncbi:nitroreductase [Spirochaetota bacterium]